MPDPSVAIIGRWLMDNVVAMLIGGLQLSFEKYELLKTLLTLPENNEVHAATALP